jgi:hypothetical protein
MGTNSDASRPDDAESAESASRTTLPRYLAAVWREAPADMARVLPWAAAGALAAGLILTHAWPKLGTAWFWAGLGMTILVCTSAAAVQYGNPAMMHRLHPKPWQEGAALLGLLAVGILAQWRLIQSPGDEGEPVDEDAGVPHSGAGAKKKPAAKNRAADEDD